MTATDELRRLLDERRVEYKANDIMGLSETCWGSTYAFQLSPDSALMMRVTPEQAVEATLGRGECKNVARVECYFSPGDFKCSECGCMVASDSEYEPLVYFTPDDFGDEIGWRFCPSCGAKVVK